MRKAVFDGRYFFASLMILVVGGLIFAALNRSHRRRTRMMADQMRIHTTGQERAGGDEQKGFHAGFDFKRFM